MELGKDSCSLLPTADSSLAPRVFANMSCSQRYVALTWVSKRQIGTLAHEHENKMKMVSS